MSDSDVSKMLNQEKCLLQVLTERGKSTPKQIADHYCLSVDDMQNDLNALLEMGLVELVPNGFYQAVIDQAVINYHQEFFIIHNEGFSYKPQTLIEGVKDIYIQYQWIIPIYVMSIDTVWNGDLRFHMSPVCFKDADPKEAGNWRWSNHFYHKDIGKTIFSNFDDAKKEYEKRFSEKQREEFAEKRKIEGLIK